MKKTAFVTNIPVPYRENIQEGVSNCLNSEYTVIYCSKLEPNREWKFNYGNYNKIFLSDKSKNYVHNNFNVWNILKNLNPDVVITTGFNPTMVYAFIWTLLKGKKHITFTDGTFNSEKKLSFIHFLIRKIVYSKSKAFIGPSKGSFELYKSYNLPQKKLFKSHLCINNQLFGLSKLKQKQFTLMFSGQMIDGKMPLFFVQVAKKVKNYFGSCNVLILGNGNLKDKTLDLLKEYEIEYQYAGFVDQELLPDFYSKAKLFLFPSKRDTWGIVVNEAMASGLPVITCENAGVANDLVINNNTGYVLPLDEDEWAKHIIKLLEDPDLYEKFSNNAYQHVQQYNFDNAKKGIIDAIEFATNEK